MIRKINSDGRISIPREILKQNNWKSNDEIEITEYDNEIILRKHQGKKCEKCNINVSKTDNFCSNCGSKL